MCVVWQNRVTIYGLINWDFVLACPCLALMFLIPNIPVCVETVLLYSHPSLLTPTISYNSVLNCPLNCLEGMILKRHLELNNFLLSELYCR